MRKTVLTLSLTATILLAEDVNPTLTTFQAGTPVNVNEVNGNFESLKQGILDLQSKYDLVVQSLQTTVTTLESEIASLESENRSLESSVVPVGTIVSSMLDFYQFAPTVGESVSFSATNSKWSPADGRSISGSAYHTSTGNSTAPDLRGMFLRGLNSIDSQSRDDGNQDPDGDNRTAGDYQEDKYKKHGHNIAKGSYGIVLAGIDLNYGPNAVYSHYRYNGGNTFSSPTDSDTAKAIETDGHTETRPKNSAVYYYIKIN